MAAQAHPIKSQEVAELLGPAKAPTGVEEAGVF